MVIENLKSIFREVKLIIDVLENNGYEAFAVGGLCKNTILDRELF